MYINIIIAVLAGTILGIFTGLTPGIHINLVASIIVAYSYYILKILDPITVIITITTMAIVHTVFDIIPSTLFGIPNTENLAMLLPAHKLTSEGKAKLAIFYGLLGSASGILTTILTMPLIVKFIPEIYAYIKDYIPFILILISSYIILKSKNKFLSALFFITTGVVGILSFDIKTIDQPLLPLLSGLFGLSALILSINNKIQLPEQKEEIDTKINSKELAKHSLTTTFASFLTNFLPGLTSSHTALVADKLIKIKNQEEYIILSNAASSSATVIGFLAFYSMGKTRSGIVAAIEFLINSINLQILILIIATSLIALSISTILAIRLSNKIIKIVSKLNYKKLSLIIMGLIICLVLVITKLEGLLILITATSIGILAQQFNVERINLTGCLILPVILYLL